MMSEKPWQGSDAAEHSYSEAAPLSSQSMKGITVSGTDLSESGVWYRDRDEWVRHLLTSDMALGTKVVGVFLAMHMNRKDNHSKHRQSVIAAETGVGIATVKRGVKELFEAGLIDKFTLPRGPYKRGLNRYSLTFSWKVW